MGKKRKHHNPQQHSPSSQPTQPPQPVPTDVVLEEPQVIVVQPKTDTPVEPEPQVVSTPTEQPIQQEQPSEPSQENVSWFQRLRRWFNRS